MRRSRTHTHIYYPYHADSQIAAYLRIFKIRYNHGMTLPVIPCPKCGRALEILPTSGRTIECPTCHNIAAVPQQQPVPEARPPEDIADLPLIEPLAEGDNLEVLEAQVNHLIAQGKTDNAIKHLRVVLNLGVNEAQVVVQRMQAHESLLDALIIADEDTARFLLARKARQGIRKYASPLEQDKFLALINLRRLRGCVVQFLWFLLALAVMLPATIYLLTQQKFVDQWIEKYNPIAYAHVVNSIEGDVPGQAKFEDARAIAIDAQGFIYIADHDDGRIYRFNSQGILQNRWSVKPAETEHDVLLDSLAAGANGLVYTAVGTEIILFDGRLGKELQRLKVDEPGTTTKISANDVFLTPSGSLAVIYNGDHVTFLDKTGKAQLSIASAVSSITGETELSGRLAVDAEGNIYVLGSFNNTVVKYAPDGRFILRFGGPGLEPGKFRSVLAIATDSAGKVFVSDFSGISIFSPEGVFERRFTIPSGVAYGITFDAQGHLWAAMSENRILELALPAPRQ